MAKFRDSDLVIKLYFKDIAKIPLLTREQEIELARKIKRGSKKARDALTRANLRLVVSIAKHYAHLGLSLSDLIEEGNIGLIKAAKRYDHQKGRRFSTYASWWIRQSILRALAGLGRPIRIPVYMMEIISRWRRANLELFQKLGKPPTRRQMAKAMGNSLEKAREIENLIKRPLSLNTPLSEDGRTTLLDTIEDEKAVLPSANLDNIMRCEAIKRIFKTITPRERRIITLRYGLRGKRPHTLRQVGEKINLSKQRVKQIEDLAIERMRQAISEEEKLLY